MNTSRRVLSQSLGRFAQRTNGRGGVHNVQKRSMGGGGGGGPHEPLGYKKLGNFCMVSMFVWIMYRAKENKGQLFGLYLPWEHPHDHEHLHFVEEGDLGDTMASLAEPEEAEDDEEEEE